jgi:hypothetical protein
VYALDNSNRFIDPTGAMIPGASGLPGPYHQPVIHTTAGYSGFRGSWGYADFFRWLNGQGPAPPTPQPRRQSADDSSTPIGSMVTGEPTSGPGSTPPAGWTEIKPGTEICEKKHVIFDSACRPYFGDPPPRMSRASVPRRQCRLFGNLQSST